MNLCIDLADMKWTAVGVLLFSAFLSLVLAYPQKVPHFVPHKLDWRSARTHCLGHFVDLATVVDVQDLAEMSALGDTTNQHVFLGLKREWQWTAVDSEDRRYTQVGFEAFGAGEPREEHECGLIQASGVWSTENCSTTWPFFCLDVNTPDRFVMGNGSKTWGEAREYCRTNHTDLARIRSQEENQLLVNGTMNGTWGGTWNGTGAWIGLTKQIWTWSDGSYTGFVPFVPQKPEAGGEEACAALHISGEPMGIVPWNCSDQLPFFCYSFPLKKHSVKITMSATQTAVDSLTELVQSRLKDMGVAKDVRVTWTKRPTKVSTLTPDKPLCNTTLTLT